MAAADHGTYWVGWHFIWPDQNKRILFTFTPLIFCHHQCVYARARALVYGRVFVCIVISFPFYYCVIVIIRMGIQRYIASHDCVYELTPVCTVCVCVCVCNSQQWMCKWQVQTEKISFLCIFDYEIEMDNAEKCKRQMIWRRFDVSSSTSSSYVLFYSFFSFVSGLCVCVILKTKASSICSSKSMCHNGNGKTFQPKKVYVLLLSLLLPF